MRYLGAGQQPDPKGAPLYLQGLDPGEIVHVRRAVEIEAAALAAEHRTAQDIVALDASVEGGGGRSLKGGFHLMIMQAAGSRVLSDIHAGLDGAVRANLCRRLRPRVVSPRVIAREHGAILTAIVASDPVRARSAFAAHAACGYLADAPYERAVPTAAETALVAAAECGQETSEFSNPSCI